MSKEKRTGLKAAAERVSALQEQIETLEAAAERAENASVEASDELEKYGDLEGEITRWRVAQLKKGASTKVLPDNLKARVEAKRAAADELEQSQTASQAIAEELRETRSKLRTADQEKTKCGIAVLHETGDTIADELKAVNIRRIELMQVLQGLAAVNMISERTGRPEGIGLTQGAVEVFNMANGFVFHDLADPTEELARRWKARLDALCANSDAEIAAPRHLLPSDYVPGTPPKYQGDGLPWLQGTPGIWKPEKA
jgi:hypothetical protein